MSTLSSSTVTILDVARRAGVSHTTVSLALRNSDRISTEVAERIRGIAQEMGYRPRLAAQLLRGNRTGRVALILPRGVTGTHPGFFSMIMSCFVHACERQEIGYHIELLDAMDNIQHELPDSVANGLVDSALLVGWYNPSLKRVLEQHGCPWVSLEEPDDHAVMSDVSSGVYGAVQHLAAMGHRRIAMMHGNCRYRVHEASLKGYQRAIADFSLEPVIVQATVPKQDSRRDMLAANYHDAARVLGLVPRPTAVISSGMLEVRHIIQVAGERGIKIPSELSLIAVGHAGDALAMWPVITSVQADWMAIVSNALRMVHRLAAGKKLEENQIIIPTRLVEGDTIARPQSA